MLVSVVIPCFQNEGQLNDTVGRIFDASKKTTDFDFELILVDDGSMDGTWPLIKELSEKHTSVSGARLKENIGAYNALLHGFERAKGDAILIMAADGDDPPELIPELIRLYSPQTDAVLAVRESSEKGLFSSLSSRIFNGTLKLIGANNIYAVGSDFMLVSKSIVDNCSSNGWLSGNTLVQLVQHAQNTQIIGYRKGRSKPSTWSFRKKVKLFFQTVNQFVSVPGINPNARQTEVAETC